MNKRCFGEKQTARSHFVIVFILVFAIFCSLAGCAYTPDSPTTETTAPNTEKQPTQATAPGTYPINWHLYGQWVTADGTESATSECAISGTVQLAETGIDSLELSIVFSKDCDYMENSSSPYPSLIRKYRDVDYCACSSFSYSISKNDFVSSCFGISLDEEYAIFHWKDKKDLYLVLSTDPDADPKEILTYFEIFVQDYTFDT